MVFFYIQKINKLQKSVSLILLFCTYLSPFKNLKCKTLRYNLQLRWGIEINNGIPLNFQYDTFTENHILELSLHFHYCRFTFLVRSNSSFPSTLYKKLYNEALWFKDSYQTVISDYFDCKNKNNLVCHF